MEILNLRCNLTNAISTFLQNNECLSNSISFLNVPYSISYKCLYTSTEHFPCLRSLIEKVKQRHFLRRNEPDTPRDEHFNPIYQDINDVVVDQCQPNDEPTDLSEPSSDLPSYIRNDAFIRPEALGKKCKIVCIIAQFYKLNLHILYTIIVSDGPIFMDFVG